MNVASALFLACLPLGTAMGADLAAYDLETEALRDPIGIDEAGPRLSWKLRSQLRDQYQAAYQIVVAGSPATLAAGQGDLWDSGRVASPESAWIPYLGAALRSFQRCWWKVRVWDAAGAASPWSDPAEWTMGVLSRGDWKGAWIAYPDTRLTSGPLPVFRKEFAIDRPLRRALAFVSGVGFHELRINGSKAGDHVLAPAWTDYRDTVLYETLDVTSLLQPGPNAIGVLLGNGFYNVAGGRYTKYTGSFGYPRLLAQLHLEFEDGTARDIATDSSWRVERGPVTFSCIYGGEDFDARLEPAGWDRPGFDDSAWRRPAGVESAGGDLRAQMSPPVRVDETFRPRKVTEPRPGVFVYDLGQNFAGWPRIEVSGLAGAQVKLTPGELLDRNGVVTQRSSGGPQSFNYTLRGSGRESWAPRFSYYGFRYVQVEGAAPEAAARTGLPVLHALEGQFIHLDAARVGRFHCSDDLFNRIHTLIDAAVRSNLQHVLTDCPHREKLGWLEQLYLMGPSLLYNWDLRAWLPKVIRDIRESQNARGLIPGIAPEYVQFGWSNVGFRDSPEWGSADVLAPWLDWQWYGNRKPLEESYGSMKRYAEYLASRSEGRLLTYGLGDWYDIGPGGPGPSKLTPLGMTATASYFADLQTLERIAQLLGHQADARSFADQAAQVREAFQKTFYKPEQNTYGTSSQTALAMPLALGLAPESARPGLLDKLVADIRSRGNHTSAGDIGYTYVIQALLQGGRSDTLFDMTNRTDPPSYGAQLSAGATSLTEAWDANPSSSQNHLMLGHIEQWFYAGLAGIRPDPDVPGLRRIRIQPEPVGGLKEVEAAWDTFRGPVEVHWTIQGESFRLGVSVPPGITAQVSLPAAKGSPRTVREIGSGRYEFVSVAPGNQPQ
ncbi:MAG TPA: family 78 glycoside hydrolase catalytic domain [Bryobacteraceae bacterium]|nr:family 78 glycoside hydrolase catalytic domain [Bryobacteraceae bacterium]